MKKLPVILLIAIAIAIGAWRKPAGAATVLLPDQVSKVLTVRNLRVDGAAVSGELVNESPETLRDVQLLIRYDWRWNNEFRPKNNPPGDAEFYTVQGEISPRGTKSFSYKPSQPLPSRTDGYFDTTVSVVGYTRIVK